MRILEFKKKSHFLFKHIEFGVLEVSHNQTCQEWKHSQVKLFFSQDQVITKAKKLQDYGFGGVGGNILYIYPQKLIIRIY